jgi:hypothetical protein
VPADTLDASGFGGILTPLIVSTASNPAQSGYVRIPNNTAAITARDSTNTVDFPLLKLGTDNLDHLLGGGADFIIPAVSDQAVGRNTIDSLTKKTLTGAGSGNNSTLLNSQDNTGNLTGNSTDQTVYTYTVPANTVAAGKGIRVYWTTQNNSAVAVTYKLTLGSTNIISVASAATADDLTGSALIFNNAGTQAAQRACCGNLMEQNTIISRITSTAAITENFANAVTLKLTFNVASPNTVQGGKWIVELIQ